VDAALRVSSDAVSVRAHFDPDEFSTSGVRKYTADDVFNVESPLRRGRSSWLILSVSEGDKNESRWVQKSLAFRWPNVAQEGNK
jgi:hypothetical protein